MKQCGRIVRWHMLLSKRLLKKFSYLLILVFIPLLIVGMGLVSEQESGMLTIVLCREDPENEQVTAVVDKLAGENGIIRFIKEDSEKQAIDAVKRQQADAAWIFPKHFTDKLKDYTNGQDYRPELVRIVECEDNIALQLAREKLFGAIYPLISYGIYDGFVRNEVCPGEQISEEMLSELYESTRVEGSIFRLVYAGDLKEDVGEEKDQYLTAPLRGMLAMLLAICSLAAVMYYKQDEQNGVFDRLSLLGREKFLFIYQWIAMGYLAIFILAAYALTDIWTDIGTEIGNMFLYIIALGLFGSLYAKLARKLTVIGATLPILMILMMVLCPVFFAVKKWRFLQYLLPAFYYLNGIYNAAFTWKMIFFCVAALAIETAFVWFREKR